ncbi:MAG: hypothetical protein NDI61_03060 [Bdellovibrionaceae bacterium]|nr:hypothetical protein [Pseudobdellovibrionaceae bacterium]
MQKISGILSGSPRVTSVDMKDAQPVRPGTPGFGRPQGVSSLRERAEGVDALRKARELQDGMLSARSKEAQQTDAAAQISEGFFMRNKRDAEPAPVGDSEVIVAIPIAIEAVVAESKPTGFKTDVAEAVKEPTFDPDALYPRGSFLDTVA